MNIKQELEKMEAELSDMRREAACIKYDLTDVFISIHKKIHNMIDNEED